MSFWQIIRTLISGIIVLYLQILVMPQWTVAGITPNLFLGWIMFEVWRKPVNVLIPIIFLLGICYDLTTPTLLGMHTIIFILLAFGVDEFHRPLEKDSYITMAITLGLVVIAYSLYIFIVFGLQTEFSFSLFLIMLGMIIYNLLISTIFTGLLVFISNLKLDFRHG